MSRTTRVSAGREFAHDTAAVVDHARMTRKSLMGVVELAARRRREVTTIDDTGLETLGWERLTAEDRRHSLYSALTWLQRSENEIRQTRVLLEWPLSTPRGRSRLSTAEAPKLTAVKGGKQTFRTVEVVKRAEHDRWDIVEAIKQDIDAAGFTAHAVNDKAGPKGIEFTNVCMAIADAARAEGADGWQARTVSILYRVAVAWPREDRVTGASYGAHERLFHRADRRPPGPIAEVGRAGQRWPSQPERRRLVAVQPQEHQVRHLPRRHRAGRPVSPHQQGQAVGLRSPPMTGSRSPGCFAPSPTRSRLAPSE